MNWFSGLITNPYLITALSSWFIAQVLKVIVDAILNRRLRFERFVGDGGMPSCHSATVVSLAVYTGLAQGTGTFAFAMAAVFAIIVCHDAMGVRMETGKQAVILNELVEIFHTLSRETLPQVRLKELVGHTPLQVIAGGALGFVNAFVMFYWVLP